MVGALAMVRIDILEIKVTESYRLMRLPVGVLVKKDMGALVDG